MNEEIDADRRLALQLAIQLPESAARARRVMALTTEILEQFMVEPQSPAHRRARLLGWGRVIEAEPFAAAAPRRRALVIARETLWGLSSLAISLPLALALVDAFHIGGSIALLLGVVMVAALYGTLPAVALTLASVALNNLLIVPPSFAFSVPTAIEIAYTVADLVAAAFVPMVVAQRQWIRRATIVSAPAVREPLSAVG